MQGELIPDQRLQRSATAALKVPVLVFELTALCFLFRAHIFFVFGGHGTHFLSIAVR